MDLREEEACPAPPDLICIDGGAECGDQQVMEQVAAHIRPGETHNEPVERPAEPVEVEENLVSFEDWKRRKLGEEEDTTVHYDELESSTTTYNAGSSVESSISTPVSTEAVRQANKTNGDNRTVEDKNNSSSSLKQKGEKAEPPKVPAHNKYNYASPDCSARIHSSSRLTQHASSLLHKSRDRYMLTPCKADEHWVVVELCDEIRVEAIEIAVWEFFSGVVREVEVSVGGANDDEDDDDSQQGRLTDTKWEKVGTFVGKNIRGVQVSLRVKAASNGSDLHFTPTNLVSTLPPARFPILLRHRILLPRFATQGVWHESDGGVQIGAETPGRHGQGSRQGKGQQGQGGRREETA
jgi:hypothetical protein